MRQPSTINLSQLPPPALIEALDSESYVAAAIADYKARFPSFTAVLESEPVIKLIEVFAYRETLLRNRVNKTALATLLAFAVGADLDQIGAFFECERMVMVPADGDVPAVMEEDERYRRRIQLAPEAFSVAGPAGAYEYHALSLDPAISDVHAYSPAEGRVQVVLAGHDGAPVADAVLFAALETFQREDIVPLTDVVTVMRAVRVDYVVEATLLLRRGPDPLAVRAEALARLAAYAAGRYRIGETAYRHGIVAALTAGGVENVTLTSPAADVAAGDGQISFMTAAAVEVAVA